MYVPKGTTSGASGLGCVGNPWLTFQPNVSVCYLNDGWNLIANVFQEINTKSTVTGYRSGDAPHVELISVETIGSWTVGLRELGLSIVGTRAISAKESAV